MTTLAQLADHPLIVTAIAFVMGLVVATLYYREKRLREGRMRYFRCKECGREHALDPQGAWHALRTVEEIQAQEKRIKEAQKKAPMRP